MPGNLLHVNATVMCPHGGRAIARPARSGVLVEGQPVVTLADFHTITGCPFNVSGTPRPCVTVQWAGASTRLRAAGSPVLLRDSPAICHSAERIPQGSPLITVVQQRGNGQ
ncbi:hypothetical protein Ssi03_68930 [Sphaerisporangium siamense]|uniref:DUF4280 domain-containing protein n=1 Tax=Sphaerisporangium siamense TaxID=795645 RepID=A0A7W7D7W2_9ACTN|nr:hypothetical protein [Sphaerisporangium siamense]MBB4700566.1 hypothetical protein [Sphaerisporangium siamense]GII88903.1 hypothetical protein Ssi03_68930 [Sphaerisporangium siamense]